jgi:hypothetical protein
MAFKAAFVAMAPDVNPAKHRATIKTPKAELTTVLVGLMNFDQAVQVCKDLVQKEGIQSLSLCPGFTNQALSRIQAAVGEGVPVGVVRTDMPGTQATFEILTREGWLSQAH